MTTPPASTLSDDDIRHVAELARLELDDDQLRAYRAQLDAVLEHIANLGSVRVEGVEPLAHPIDLVNRLDADEVGPSLPVDTLLGLAPAVESGYIAVPKVLD